MRTRPLARLAGLSPRRRALVALVAVIAVALAAFGGVRLTRSGSPPESAYSTASRPSYVLLVPGYGGSTTALSQLAERIRATGRTATVVQLAGNGTGDLTAQAGVLNGYVNDALSDGSGPVTVIGYSAGGVVAWLWDVDYGGTAKVRRFITLGSPLHGAQLAALGAAFVPGECPVACQQLVPGSSVLRALQSSPASAQPPWLSLWTTDDQVVQPPDSARLPGAVNVPLQSICPSAVIQHGGLPTSPLVTGIVLRALGSKPLAAPGPGQCQSLETLGSR
jgi:pimeloyl-ACP methyl ester carboxylesterase